MGIPLCWHLCRAKIIKATIDKKQILHKEKRKDEMQEYDDEDDLSGSDDD